MTLQDWLSNGWVKPHKSSASEVRNLLAKVDRDIAEAEKPGDCLGLAAGHCL